MPASAGERVYLVHWARSRPAPLNGAAVRASPAEALQELADLAASAGATVAGSSQQRSPAPHPSTLIGRGKIDEIRSAVRATGAPCVIFANDLTPTQLRNLESALDVRVVDRTQLILDIFARRARTREGKLQVELAQLNYLLPRLAGQGARLSRLGGGIGTRGPGEQQLETDRRRIRTRIRKLKTDLEGVRVQRSLHRDYRRQQRFLTVALVGYTNAGKSTLFNTLTGSRTLESSRLFATLDPTTRALRLKSGRKALLSDTVGFIRDLPPHLVASFRATLEELESATLLVHVVDISSADFEQQIEAVARLIDALGLAATPMLYAWNKVDLLPGAATPRREAPGVSVSAKTGEGTDTLLARIDDMLSSSAPAPSEPGGAAGRAGGEAWDGLHPENPP